MKLSEGQTITVKVREKAYGYDPIYLEPGETITVINPAAPAVTGARPYFAYCERTIDGRLQRFGIFPDNIALVDKRPRVETAKQQAYLFFLRNAGSSYNPKTQTKQQGRSEGARKLAAAERDARALGYTFEWEDDWSLGCSHFKFYGECYKDGEPSTCESCLMIDAAGKVVQSLSCIDDATREYRRVIEAKLTLEEVGK